MKLLFDGISLYLNKDDSSTFSLEVLKYFKNFFNFYILTDSFISNDKRVELLKKTGNNISLFEEYIDRNNYVLDDIHSIIKNNDFNFFTCFNNALCIPSNIELNNDNQNFYKTISFLYSVYPLFEDNIKNLNYKNRFKKTVVLKANTTYKTFVFSNFHYNLAITCGINRNLLTIIYPFLPKIYTDIDKHMSYSYVKSKFDISSNYLICIGNINESFKLEKILSFFYEFKRINPLTKLVIVSYGEKVPLEKTNDIIILRNITTIDEVNLLTSSLALIDYTSPYSFNLSKLKALFTSTPLITDLNQLNLEYFEDYPIYESEEALNLAWLSYRKNNTNKVLIDNLKKKFSIDKTLETLLKVYGANNHE